MKPARQFTPEQKTEVVLQLLNGHVPVGELTRQHQVSHTAIYQWRDQFLDGARLGLQGQTQSKREELLERENERLKQMVGEYALANWALKKVQGGQRLPGGVS